MTWSNDDWPGEHGWCADAPFVMQWSPPPGTTRDDDVLLFLVQTATPPIVGLRILARFVSGRAEIVFENGAFSRLYRRSSRMVAATDSTFTGWRFAIRRLTPWPEPVALEFEAANETGLLCIIGGGPVPGRPPGA